MGPRISRIGPRISRICTNSSAGKLIFDCTNFSKSRVGEGVLGDVGVDGGAGLVEYFWGCFFAVCILNNVK